MKTKPRSMIRAAIQNIALLAASSVAFLLFCEFVVFRFLIPGADVEANAFIDDVIRYKPETSGVFRRVDEIEARFSINQNGWNSPHASYALERTPGIQRVAIVGDSYVHAREVDVDKTFAEVIERDLVSEPGSLEVFRFGIKGAPLSQYLHMLRKEVLRFQPDLIIVPLIHNDFDETFRPRWGRYIKSFMHLNIENGEVVSEKEPLPYEPGWTDVISASATYSTLERRYGAVGTLKSLVSGADEETVYQANIDVAAVSEVMDDIAVATDYVFEQFAGFSKEHGIKLVLVMDGHRDAIYAEDAGKTVPLALNQLSADVAAKHGLPFLDLHPHFQEDWQANQTVFNFESDGHWNEYGHQLVAAAINDWIQQESLLAGL